MGKRMLALGVVLTMCGAAMGQSDSSGGAAAGVNAQPEEKAPVLKVGDRAPALEVKTWVKGEPITGFEKGRVYVVEFWATWCGPCRDSIPHLTELQKRMKDKGVTVIGVSVMEEKGLEDVAPFVEKMGAKMDYTVGWDGDRRVYPAWMEASGQQGIPSAFVVNQEGRVAWIGHPLAKMDLVVDRVVSGKYDMATAVKAGEMQARINEKLRVQDFDAALVIVDELIALDPEMYGSQAMLKFNVLAMAKKDEPAAYAYIGGMMEKHLWGDAQSLNAIAWTIVDFDGFTTRDYKLAIKAATRAVELTAWKDAAILDTLAKAYFDSGDKAKGLELQEKAVGALEAGSPFEAELKQRLEEYRKAVKGQG